MKRRGSDAPERALRNVPLRRLSDIAIRSDVTLPPRVLPWERELLLPHVRALLDSVLQGDATDADDEKG